MFIEGPELCVFRLCGFVPISCGSPLSCTGLVIVCQSSRPNCTHNPSTWNEAVLDDSASSLPSIKTSCFFDHSPLYILMNIYCIIYTIYIYIHNIHNFQLLSVHTYTYTCRCINMWPSNKHKYKRNMNTDLNIWLAFNYDHENNRGYTWI